MCSKVDIDMVNRDPNDINLHVKVAYEDVIAEPDGAHSFNCVWSCAYRTYSCCKSFAYNLLTILSCLPLSICWGCLYAYVSFYSIWIITPLMRFYLINCGCCQKFYSACIQCYYQPCYEAMSYCFSNIRVTNMSG
ncbi:caveolin-1-like [Biomphalaria glabrata]|uniref:Caveolin n=1 Tax=Biomphalaria glabrata TaxID=6526 RepID=A0A9U8EFW6_BIOGL|nr:caveolin-1-like [Biomphalaria glabrata]